MAKKVTTQRRQEAEPSMMDHLEQYRFGGETKDMVEKGEKKDEPSVADLLSMVTNLTNRLDQAEKTNLALMSAPPVDTTPRPAPAPKATEYPDPTLDPQGYAKALQEDAQRIIADARKADADKLAAANREREQADALWSAFSKEHEDYAESKDRVEFAASLVMKDIQGLGISPQAYMTKARGRFFEDVVKKMDTVFGKPNAEEGKNNDDQDEGRTAGIFGGMESAGKPTKGKEPAPDFIEDLQAMQRKSGFF